MKSLLLTFVIITLVIGIIIIVVIILTRLSIFGKICFSQKQLRKNASTRGEEYLIFSDGGKLSVTPYKIRTRKNSVFGHFSRSAHFVLMSFSPK